VNFAEGEGGKFSHCGLLFFELCAKKSVGNLVGCWEIYLDDVKREIKIIATIAGLTSQARILFPLAYT
jgi:hypothetical protein